MGIPKNDKKPVVIYGMAPADCIVLDTLLEENFPDNSHISIIKIDIEGAGRHALAGCKNNDSDIPLQSFISADITEMRIYLPFRLKYDGYAAITAFISVTHNIFRSGKVIFIVSLIDRNPQVCYIIIYA